MELSGARVIDLFAGSGAIAFEALSRGAAHALLIEHDPKAVRVIRANIATLKSAEATVLGGKVATVLAAGNPGEPYDLVFADPPYPLGEDELTEVLQSLADNGWLAQDALVVLERSRRSPEPSWVEGITGGRSRRYGESTLWYGRAVAQRSAATQPERRAQ